MTKAIEVENLTKYYGNFLAIKNINFSVDEGEIVGLLGPNGAGKSTTIKILTGYLTPTSGTAKIFGYDVILDSLKVREIIGYLPETVPLYNEMNVLQYLKFVAEVKKVPKKLRKDLIDYAITKCELSAVLNKLIKELSKGFRQRVGIAQALVNNPKILILDEPTIGLDPKQIIEIRNLIKGFKGERTVLLSSHNLYEVQQICTRVIIINKGEVVSADAQAEVGIQSEKYDIFRLTVIDNQRDVKNIIISIPGIINVKTIDKSKDNLITYEIKADKISNTRPIIIHKIISNGIELVELKSVGLSLEEFFLNVVTEKQTEEVIEQ